MINSENYDNSSLRESSSNMEDISDLKKKMRANANQIQEFEGHLRSLLNIANESELEYAIQVQKGLEKIKYLIEDNITSKHMLLKEMKKGEDLENEIQRITEEMEKNKIGTDASMPVHIENICQRGYVKVDENRKLIPTKLGKALIEALGEVDPEIIHPDNRAKIEGFVDEVAHGKKRYAEVLKYALDLYKEKYLFIRVHYDKLLKAFEKYFQIDLTKLTKAMRYVKNQNEKYKSGKYVQKK